MKFYNFTMGSLKNHSKNTIILTRISRNFPNLVKMNNVGQVLQNVRFFKVMLRYIWRIFKIPMVQIMDVIFTESFVLMYDKFLPR